MRRREFLGALGGAAALPLAARADPQVPVIAILGSGAADAPSSKTQLELMRAGMRDLFAPFAAQTGADFDPAEFHLLGTSGTVTLN